jgi:hypothetical protein
MTTTTSLPHRLRTLLRGEPQGVVDWIDDRGARGLVSCVGVIVVGCGLYGASVGLWRSPLQAAYVAVKIPLVILLTAAGNAALNGMLAQLLGTGLSFRQTSLAIACGVSVLRALRTSRGAHVDVTAARVAPWPAPAGQTSNADGSLL